MSRVIQLKDAQTGTMLLVVKESRKRTHKKCTGKKEQFYAIQDGHHEMPCNDARKSSIYFLDW